MGREKAREAICCRRRPRLAPSWPTCPLCLGPEEGAVWGLEGSCKEKEGQYNPPPTLTLEGPPCTGLPSFQKDRAEFLPKAKQTAHLAVAGKTKAGNSILIFSPWQRQWLLVCHKHTESSHWRYQSSLAGPVGVNFSFQ